MSKKNILVTGSSGQLGMELQAAAGSYAGLNFIFTTKETLSISDTDSLEDYFSKNAIGFCINCAAYTAVDRAEEEPEHAFKINAEAVGNLAKVCTRFNARLIHISTDYIFSGDSTEPYTESHKPMPVNLYGRSKLAGEIQAVMNAPDFIIIRTSWLYSSFGKNFVKTMVRLLREKEKIRVVNDQYGSPTYAADLAHAIIAIIIHKDPEAGVYHYSNKGIITWYVFAEAIKELINSDCKIEPIITSEYPTPAKRPAYSAFDTNLIQDKFGVSIPYWEDSLKICIERMDK